MTITATKSATKPDYKPLARVLLEEINRFFEDPANQADYEKWLEEYRKEKRGTDG